MLLLNMLNWLLDLCKMHRHGKYLGRVKFSSQFGLGVSGDLVMSNSDGSLEDPLSTHAHHGLYVLGEIYYRQILEPL